MARREFVERLKDRSFLASTIITTLIIVAVIVVPPLLGFGDPERFDVGVAGSRAAAYGTAIRAQADALDVDVDVRRTGSSAAAALLADGTLDAVVDGERVRVEQEVPAELEPVLQTAHRAVATQERLAAGGIDPAAVARAGDVPPLQVAAADPPDPGQDTRRGVAFAGIFILYGQLLGYGFWVALGVVEEKSSRVVEVLLATIPARALLAGKVIGIGLLGFAQLLLIAVVGVVGAVATDRVPIDSDVLEPIALVLVWFVLGYAFYACAFAAAAARVSRQEELQNATTPATVVVLVSLFAAFAALDDPGGLLAGVLSFVPPFSALVQPVRGAAGDVPLWETLASMAIMALACVLLVGVAARLYEGAVLRTGARVSLRDAWAGRRRAEGAFTAE